MIHEIIDNIISVVYIFVKIINELISLDVPKDNINNIKALRLWPMAVFFFFPETCFVENNLKMELIILASTFFFESYHSVSSKYARRQNHVCAADILICLKFKIVIGYECLL